MTGPNPRDPLTPGAPIIPHPDWHLPPHHRWSFRHMREMTATTNIRRGQTPARPFAVAPEDLGQTCFESTSGRTTLDAFLANSSTDAFLVLHGGKIVMEQYFHGMQPHEQHLSMSVAKSILGLVTGILVHRGEIELAASVKTYLPELGALAYGDASVQQLLDMTSGVTFDESYETPGSHMQKLGNACAWGGRGAEPGWPETIWQLVLELTETERPHGERFVYRSIETDVLGFLVERVTAKPLAQVVSEELWQKIGAEEDACYTVDQGGFALADGGFNATLRDYARIARLLLEGGHSDGVQILPEAWLQETRFGRGGLFDGNYADVLPKGGYHNKFWQVDPARGVILARGIYGQFIHVDPQNEFAAVKLSTWPGPLDKEGAIDTIAAFEALARRLGGTI